MIWITSSMSSSSRTPAKFSVESFTWSIWTVWLLNDLRKFWEWELLTIDALIWLCPTGLFSASTALSLLDEKLLPMHLPGWLILPLVSLKFLCVCIPSKRLSMLHGPCEIVLLPTLWDTLLLRALTCTVFPGFVYFLQEIWRLERTCQACQKFSMEK